MRSDLLNFALKFCSALAEARKNQWLDAKSLAKLQTRRLRHIIDYAYRHVGFYRQLFSKERIDPYSIETIEDLCKFPVVTRSELVRAFPKRIVSDEVTIRECVTIHSSGLTGEPGTFLFTRDDWAFHEGIALRPQIEAGVRIGDNVAVITSPRVFSRNSIYRLLAELGRYRNLSVFEDSRYLLHQLKRFKPTVLKSYPSVLTDLLDLWARSGGPDDVKAIFSMSEPLSRSVRDQIQDLFDAEIFDLYGATEVTSLAWECGQHRGLHQDMDSALIEILRNGETVSSGESGSIVITSFRSQAMPLLRYELGDVETQGDVDCPCGRKLRLIERVEGKEADMLILPSGRRLRVYVLTEVISWSELASQVARFQIIQEKGDRIRVSIVPGKAYTENTCETVAREMKKVLPEVVDIHVSAVDQIPKEPSGKTPLFLNYLRDFQSK